LGREAAASAATYEEARHAGQANQGVGAEVDSIVGVRLGYEREEEENAYTRTPRGSDTERGEGEAGFGRLTGPARYAACVEKEHPGLIDGRLRKPSGPAA
jgi:hypothetical protein